MRQHYNKNKKRHESFAHRKLDQFERKGKSFAKKARSYGRKAERTADDIYFSMAVGTTLSAAALRQLGLHEAAANAEGMASETIELRNIIRQVTRGAYDQVGEQWGEAIYNARNIATIEEVGEMAAIAAL